MIGRIYRSFQAFAVLVRNQTFRTSRPWAAAAIACASIIALYFALDALYATYLASNFTAPLRYEGQSAGGSIAADVFVRQAPIDLRTPSAYLFGGALADIQAYSTETTGKILFVLAMISGVAGFLTIAVRRNSTRAVFLIAVASLSIFWSLRIAAGWDEYFINLKHAFNLAYDFKFSANLQSNLEATVDFAPFALSALLARTFNLNLVDVGLVVSLSGNVLCIVSAFLLVRRLTMAETPAVFAAVAVGLAPLVINVGGTGFMSALFAGLVLTAAYWFVALRGRWTLRAYAFVGCLTLFRTEAVLFAGLLWAADTIGFGLTALAAKGRLVLWKKAARIIAFRLALGVGPFILSVLVRSIVFGEPVPVPVAFKNSAGEVHYVRAGLGYLLACIQLFRLDWLVAILGVAIARFLFQKGRKAIIFVLSLIIFTLAYATGGGDWFPPHWARYIAPLVIIVIAISGAALYTLFKPVSPRARPFVFGLSFVALATLLYGGGSSQNAYRDLASDWPKSLNRWERVDNLSAYGDFLRQTLPAEAVIASPEDASLMYHAERDMVDLLGIANSEIAHSPLDPLGPGDLMHRRRNIDVVKHERPDVIALFEMSFVLGPEFAISNVEAIKSFVSAFPLSQFQLDLSFYRVGSYGYLKSLGYRPVVVVLPGRLFFYWVSSEAYQGHVSALRGLDFQPVGPIELQYNYSKSYTDRFYGGLPFARAGVSVEAPAGNELVSDLAIESDKTWTLEGLPRPFVPETPPAMQPAYGSWSGSDANTGTIRFGPIKLDPKQDTLFMPVMRGPSSSGQVVRLMSASSGEKLAELPLELEVEHKWYWASFDLKQTDHTTTEVVIEVIDGGGDWGQWSAAGAPRIARKPPE